MPKVDWAPITEKIRCTHQPLCFEWMTAAKRRIRVCRMSEQHLANSLAYADKAIRYYDSLANSAYAYAERKYYLMAADYAERAGNESMDAMVAWMALKDILLRERDRRNGIEAPPNPFGPDDCPTCGAEAWVCDHD